MMGSLEYGLIILTILGAGIIRGYSGFGFAMICVVVLSFILSPAQVTPVILCLDIAGSLWLFLNTRKQVDWKELKWIGLGSLVTLPLGSMALLMVPVNLMRIFISLVILLLCVFLLKQNRPVRSSGLVMVTGVGMVSGFLTGVAAIGGPPVILFYFSSDRAVSVSRATMIAFFLMVDITALCSSAWYGLVSGQTLKLFAVLFVPMMVGIAIGNTLFGKMSSESGFRKQVILFLMIIAGVSLVKFSLFS